MLARGSEEAAVSLRRTDRAIVVDVRGALRSETGTKVAGIIDHAVAMGERDVVLDLGRVASADPESAVELAAAAARVDADGGRLEVLAPDASGAAKAVATTIATRR